MSVTKIKEKLLQAISGLEDGSMTKENDMAISALSQTCMSNCDCPEGMKGVQDYPNSPTGTCKSTQPVI